MTWLLDVLWAVRGGLIGDMWQASNEYSEEEIKASKSIPKGDAVSVSRSVLLGWKAIAIRLEAIAIWVRGHCV